jgi:hypothetical protein
MYGIYNYAEKEILNYSKGKIVLQSLDGMYFKTDALMAAYSKETMLLLSDGSLIADGARSSLFTSTSGSAICAGSSSTALGNEDIPLGVKYDEDSIFIDIIKGAVPMGEIISSIEEAKPPLENPIEFVLFKDPSDFEKLKFNFLKSTRYGNLNPNEDAIPASMAQQDDKLTSLYGLSGWTEVEINGTLPYPGKDKFENFYMDADKPINLRPIPNGKSWCNKAESVKTPCSVTLKSLQTYKIQK